MCDTNKRISVALEITENLPEDYVLQRWLAEPIKAVVISTNLFLTNKKGYPVLSKAHQGFLRSLFKVVFGTVAAASALHFG
jgi:protein arginine N-methyltransferase 5